MNRRLTYAVIAASLIASVALMFPCSNLDAESPDVATFNVELYPKHPGHGEAIFEQVNELGSPIVAVQEIRDAGRFRAETREYLGSSWRYAGADKCKRLCLGVLFDSQRVSLVTTRTHEDTQIHRGARPIFEAVFEAEGMAVSLFVVHLKAKPNGLKIREQQLRALSRVINESRPRRTIFVVAGDFNSVTERDQRLLRRFSDSTGLVWNSEGVECSHYWQREESCITSTLDHVFTSQEEARSRPEAACASVGCEMGRQCPIYRRRVSDHCPVTVELD